MHLHNKFKWLPVTLTKLLDDDIPLYMWPNAAIKNGDRKDGACK